MVFATLAFLGAFGADQGLLTYFADLGGPGLLYAFTCLFLHDAVTPVSDSCSINCFVKLCYM